MAPISLTLCSKPDLLHTDDDLESSTSTEPSADMQTFATFSSAFLAPLDRSHENLSDIAVHCEDLALVAPGEPTIAEAQSYAEQGVAALTYQVGEMNRALKRWIEETEKVTARMGLQVTHLEEAAPEPSPVPAPEPPIQSSPAKPATVLPAPVIVEVPKISGTRVIRAKVQAPLKPATAAEEAMALLGGSAASFGPSPLQRPMPMQIGGGWNDSRSSFPSQNRRLSITTPGIFDPPPPASNAAATGLPTPPPLPTEVKFKAPPPPTKDPPAAAVAARDDGAANTGPGVEHSATAAAAAASSCYRPFKQPANRAAQIPLPPAPTAPPRPTAGVAITSLSPPPPPPPPPAVSTANASPAKDYSLLLRQLPRNPAPMAPARPLRPPSRPAALSKSARATGEEGLVIVREEWRELMESRSGPPTGSVAARPGVAPAMDLQSQLRARLQARSAAAAAATNGE
ncbi:hypothetical protein DFJ73DRAFT_800192 [Zopfochytrium polystomum]|nr:hypothetical protein DFJ73DRAFT_800192 [Zopfochytrium polystomum]